MTFYTYVLFDPRYDPMLYGRYRFEGEPFYVGKGIGRRHKCHIHESRLGPNAWKSNSNVPKLLRISEIESEGFEVGIRIFEQDSEERAFVMEKRLIKAVGRSDIGEGPLLNRTDGGEGPTGYTHPPEVRKKIRKNSRDPEITARRVATFHKTLSKRTEKESLEIRRNISKASQAVHDRRTKKERDEIYEARNRRRKRKPRTVKLQESIAKSATMRKVHEDATPEQRAERYRNHKPGMFPPVTDATRRKISKSVRLTQASKSSSELEATSRKRRATWTAKSDEDIKNIVRKIQTSISPASRKAGAAKRLKTMKNRTPEQKAASAEKRRQTFIAKYGTASVNRHTLDRLELGVQGTRNKKKLATQVRIKQF